MIQTILAGHQLSLMDFQRAEAAGQMKLRVGQLVRFRSFAQTPHCKPPWLDSQHAGVGVHAAGAYHTAGVLAPSPLSSQSKTLPSPSLCCPSDSLAQALLHSCPLMTDITMLWSSAIGRREEERVSGTSVWKILPYLIPCWTGHYNGVC